MLNRKVLNRSGIIAILVVLLGFGLFYSTWTDAIQIADSGEMAVAACKLGVAHPPGYPLYTLLGHLFCKLPWSTPAGRVGFLSMIAGLWALVMLYKIIELLTENIWAAAVSALTAATGSIFWRYCSSVEVFALNAALALTVVWTSLKAGNSAISPRASLFLWPSIVGFCLGLALSNHHSAILVSPIVMVAVLSPFRSAKHILIRSVAAISGFAIGLLPYLQLILTPVDRIPRWGDTSHWQGFWHHFLRRDYGTFSLALGEPVASSANVYFFLRQVPSQMGWVLWPLAIVGIIVLTMKCFRPKSTSDLRHHSLFKNVRRELLFPLALLPLVAGPIFMLLFNIPPHGTGAQITERFHILPVLLLNICLGVGLAVIDVKWFSREEIKSKSRRRLWQITVGAIVILFAVYSYPRADVSKNYVVEDYAINSLQAVAPGALILGIGDVQIVGHLYAQEMLRLRPDVQYVDVRMLLTPWYVNQKRRERPAFSYRYHPGNVDTIGLIRAEMERGVPVYLAVMYNQKVQAAYPGYPVGPLFRLVPPGARMLSPQEVKALNLQLFPHFLRRGNIPDPQIDPWSASLLETYARTWGSIARALYQAGDHQEAKQAISQGQSWAPWLPIPSWFKWPSQ